METLRVINPGIKNVGFRSLSELERALDVIRAQVQGVDEAIDLITASELKITGLGPPPKRSKIIAPGTPSPAPNRPGKVDQDVELLDGPTASTIQQNSSMIKDLHDQLNTLDRYMAELDFQFKNDRNHDRVQAATKTLRDEVASKLKKGLVATNAIAKGHVSKEFTKMFGSYCSVLLEELKRTFDSSHRQLLVDTSNGHIRFTYYLIMKNLQDDKGKVIPEYCFILTNLVDTKLNQYYANNLLMFKMPGRFSPGSEITTVAEALDVSTRILRMEGFRQVIMGDDLPLTGEDVDIRKFKDICTAVEVLPSSVEFSLRSGVDQKDTTSKLFQLFKGLVASKLPGHTDIRYTYRPITRSGPAKLIFYLHNKSRLALNRVQLKSLQTSLNLTDEQVVRVQQAL